MSVFDAWAFPPGAPAPTELRETPVEPGGGQIRFPEPDAKSLMDSARTLARARDRILLERRAISLARTLGRVGGRFLDTHDPLRRETLELLPSLAGLSTPMSRTVLDGMAADWTGERLQRLLELDLVDPALLDSFRPGPSGSALRALGPRLSFHVCAGTVPGVSVTSLIRALLVKSAVVLKPARSDVVLPVLFARALSEEDPELARAVMVQYWPGGRAGVAEDALLEMADGVVVYGSDETVRSVRDRTPVTARFVAYRHRIGAGLVGRDALVDRESARRAAERAARSVALFDQRGCVSPHVLYVERWGRGEVEGAVEIETWAELLADALGALEETLPSGPLTTGEASELQQLRGSAELLAAAGRGGPVIHGGRAPWTVLVEAEPGFRPSCLGRVVRIRPVEELGEAVEELREVGRFLQTVWMDGVGRRREQIAEALASAGAVRITTPRRAPWPAPWWRHDGAGPLGALIRWVELDDGDGAGETAED